MKITDFLKDNILFLDGGMGTLLQKNGLKPGELPERLNLSRPELITQIHREYYNAGSHVVSTNTFGANRLKFSAEELENIIKAAVGNAKAARQTADGDQPKWVALDVGPSGKMLAPYGDLPFEDAVDLFKETVRLGVKYGVDLIFIETMNDSYETKAALLAAKEVCDLPVFVSNAYSQNGCLMTGASPAAMTAMLEGMGADAIGLNCSFGPKALSKSAEEYLKHTALPVLFKPNAGLPKNVDGETVFDVSPVEFAEEVTDLVRKGVRIVGGCCGTTPEYIRAVTERLCGFKPHFTNVTPVPCVSSYTHAVVFDGKPVLIGERINPTGKKKLAAALREHEMEYLLQEGIRQAEKGADVLDVNVGLPEIDEPALLQETVCELQTVTDLPLQIDTADPIALENALRRYNGKAMINSVNGSQSSMETVFPLAKKYGGLIVALTLDENGIPATADGRIAIAKRIIKTAEQYGIGKHDLIFDPLTMTVSTDRSAANETLCAVERIRNEFGCAVSLGVSNVSFGLPQRTLLNGTFLTMALTKGLSAAIINPFSDEIMKAYYTFNALSGTDDRFADYMDYTAGFEPTDAPKPTKPDAALDLQYAIIKGLKEPAATLTEEFLKTKQPLDIVKTEIIPALDKVGIAFENQTVYLPQLLMSAEAAQSAFEVIKAHLPKEQSNEKCCFVLATVQGDIHDIGKNIVKLLLENYGYRVIDLGKDVAPETVLAAVIKHHAPLLGLSALMTTTVPAMAKTVALVHHNIPDCKIIVGGAVLTEEVAGQMGADGFARDAMETVRFAERSMEK